MALPAKTIKSKIKSVSNVRKITRAMEKVAAVKMRRMISRTFAAREYAFHTYSLLVSLLNHRYLKHPFFLPGAGDKILVVAVSSNRGLSGSTNAQLARALKQFADNNPGVAIEVVAVGRKMEQMARRLGLPLVASFIDVPDVVHTRDILPVARYVKDVFRGGAYREVRFLYNHFVSSLVYEPIVRQVLPFTKDEIEAAMERAAKDRFVREERKFYEYTFESGQGKVLDFIIPKILEIKTHRILLEARLCEHSARMVAMKNASDNAKTLIDDLTVNYNRARQEGITREISEIAAGAAALSG